MTALTRFCLDGLYVNVKVLGTDRAPTEGLASRFPCTARAIEDDHQAALDSFSVFAGRPGKSGLSGSLTSRVQ